MPADKRVREVESDSERERETSERRGSKVFVAKFESDL